MVLLLLLQIPIHNIQTKLKTGLAVSQIHLKNFSLWTLLLSHLDHLILELDTTFLIQMIHTRQWLILKRLHIPQQVLEHIIQAYQHFINTGLVQKDKMLI